MYSKVVYDYFNSDTKKFKFKPNKLTRTNAFKKKATKKTVIVPKKSNTSTKIETNSSQIEDASQKITQTTENRSTVSVVYDTVQCIWKYAKSFISNQNSDSSRFQERSRKKNKYRTSRRNNDLKPLRKVPSDENEVSCDPINATNEKLSNEYLPQESGDIMEETAQYYKEVDEDLLTKTFANLQEPEEQQIKGLHFENPEKLSVCKELDIFLLDTNNEILTTTNCDDITSKETQNIKPNNENTSCKISIKRNQPKKKLTELYNNKQDFQNNDQTESESLNVVELQILKSSMKTYGRGKRKNKKLHVHFKDEYDNENRKYSAHTSKKLRKSDCYHPNAFLKKITIDKKNSTYNKGKKRRLALCTKSSRSSLKKKKPKRNSSSNISVQSKSSDFYGNKAGKKTRKTPKKYSVYATTKIYKRKRGKNCKKTITNEKGIKTLQNIIKTIGDTKFDESVNTSQNNTNDVLKANNIGDELCCSQDLIYLNQAKTSGNDNLFGKGQNKQLNKAFFENISNKK